jgi:predicted MPP superfamily phosphohydrolase
MRNSRRSVLVLTRHMGESPQTWEDANPECTTPNQHSCWLNAAITRRSLVRRAGFVATAIVLSAGSGALSTALDEPVIEYVDIRMPRLPQAFDGFRIVQLSDFHYDPFFDDSIIRSAVAKTNELKPDLVVLTGDYVTHHKLYGREQAAHGAEPCGRLLQGIRSRLGTFAVLGNHDVMTDPNFVTATLERNGVRVLRNVALPFEQERTRIWLAGVDDVLEKHNDLDQTLKNIPSGDSTIVLVHEPDYADVVSRRHVDLELSGHSHGGQVRLPFIGAPYLPPLARKYPWGLRKVRNLLLYTNRGLGTIGVPLRLNCPPEITVVTLRMPA